MFYLLLVSGAALFAAGAVLAAQARIIEAGLPIPRAALGLLAAFAVARGASDWAELGAVVEARGGGAETVATLHVVLLATSFALLLGFALVLLGPDRRRSSVVPAIGISALAAWGISLTALLQSAHTVAPPMVEVFTRWLLGLPASVCAAMTLLALARSLELESWVGSRLVRGAGLAFLVHGTADAVGGLPGIVHAAWPLAAGVLGGGFGLVIGIVETGSAAAMAVLLSEAFVFQTSQRLRREESHLRDDFIALIAHELGNPVAALELAAERLDISRRGGRAIDTRLAGDVKACALTLRRMITDLLDTSRIHACELETTPTVIELRPVLERAAQVASAHDPGRPQVTLSCPDDLPPVVADPARVDQILGNLLTNATKYSAPGSPVAVAVEPGDGRVTLQVANEGPCIDPGEASRIFSRHYRAHAATRGTARGLGLGLYVARALVEAQGGRIWVDSRDRRTVFCFTLPTLAEAPGATLAVAPSAALASGDDRSLAVQ